MTEVNANEQYQVQAVLSDDGCGGRRSKMFHEIVRRLRLARFNMNAGGKNRDLLHIGRQGANESDARLG
jgi:hypothetical protein